MSQSNATPLPSLQPALQFDPQLLLLAQPVRRSTLYMYPDGSAAAANVMPITALDPSPDYAAIARAHGAHAERVDDGAALPAAIQRALEATRSGRQALLEVIVGY